MLISSLRATVITALLLLPIGVVHAESVLDHVPDDTIGFVAIRNLAATNAKIEGVTKIFQEISPMPIPAPLPVLKAATGLGAGLNEQGDALLALLPGDDGVVTPRPLLIVAVSDYAAFAASINGDATGEVCRVTIAGEEILVAQRGSYAVLMNVEHRERLESLLAAETKAIAALEPFSDWLAHVDVAAVLTPSGVDMLTAMGRQGIAGQRAAMAQRLAEPEMADSLKQVQQSLQMYESLLGFLGAELEAAAAGLAIDDDSNVKLVSRVTLSKTGELAEASAEAASHASPLAGYPDAPYVFAAGGPVPPAYGDATAVFIRKLLEANPESHGFQELTEQEWQELEDSWKSTMKGMRSMSMIMLPGEEEEPLYSNVYGIMSVEDPKAYLETYAKAMEKWNDLLSRTTSDIKLEYKTSEVKVDGKPGILLTTEFGDLANDPNVPMMKPMMEAMFGEDGTMRMYLVAADEKNVVMGIAEESAIANVMANLAEGEVGLAEASATQTTVKLLDPKAPWIGVLSPQGTVAWATRFANMFMAQFGQGVPTIPEFPDSPPLGFSVNYGAGAFSTEMAWPADTLKSLAAYIKKVQDTF